MLVHTSPHYDYLLQQIFVHATMAGWGEHECTICQGQRELLLELDLGDTGEQVKREILDAIKECLWSQQLTTQPKEEQRRSPATTSQPDPHRAFAAANHCMYKRCRATEYDSCEEMMALVRYAHPWALVAAAILEETME